MATTTYSLIGKQTVGTNGAASVTFSSIPQTYTDLKVVLSTRDSATAATWNEVDIAFNGVSTSYSGRFLYGSGSGSAASFSAPSATTIGMYDSSSTSTTSTFANSEIYIPNYAGSNNKSFGFDTVTENNATAALAMIGADLWANTAAITSMTFTPIGSASFSANSTFYLYGISNSATQNGSVPYASGGDVITTDGTYWYHAFKASGTFTPKKALSCDVLVVAGGGSGGWPYSGGGGAGGVYYASSQSLANAVGYTVTVGAGAAGAYNTGNGVQGGNSQFGSLTAAVGGGGGIGDATATTAKNGGSGGGGADYARNTAGNTGGTGTSGQGNNGGNGSPNASTYASGGGGGGAGAAGSNATSTVAGAGGVGVSTYSSWGAATLTGENVGGTYYFAGGGGGGTNGTSFGAGGSGGGGKGAANGGTSGQYESAAGTANTGGGSGGGAAGNAPASPKNGGSGIVIVRYAV